MTKRGAQTDWHPILSGLAETGESRGIVIRLVDSSGKDCLSRGKKAMRSTAHGTSVHTHVLTIPCQEDSHFLETKFAR